MITAQEHFRAVVRDRLAPALRSMGLRGSGQIYTLPSESCWAQLGLQRHKWSDRTAVQFTANLNVVSRSTWEQALVLWPDIGAKPTPNVFTPVADVCNERIGLVAGVGDCWWPLSADGRDDDATCRDFLTMVGEHGLPFLEREVAART
ncbi:DUF4304 domain-containing protein [Isoptericola sp. NPDC056573]|uniref:DUF4304 domain-containing protein n=1 Tax=Isoptericola sp. NPDC056573 TaxID=3345868 RepID=UPI0036805E0D